MKKKGLSPKRSKYIKTEVPEEEVRQMGAFAEKEIKLHFKFFKNLGLSSKELFNNNSNKEYFHYLTNPSPHFYPSGEPKFQLYFVFFFHHSKAETSIDIKYKSHLNELESKITKYGPTVLGDSRFLLSDYLQMKDQPTWNEAYGLKSKSFYEAFPLFLEFIMKTLSEEKELRDLLTGKIPWRNPPLDSAPKVNLLKFRRFLNKRLIPGPEAFKKVGLIYRKKRSSVKYSKVTPHIEHTWDYYHENPQSKIALSTYFVPEVKRCSASLMKFEEGYSLKDYPRLCKPYSDHPPLSNLVTLSDYLGFKKNLVHDLYKASLNYQERQDSYKIFESFIELLTDAILNEGFGDMIQGKWEDIPTYPWK